MVGGISAVSGDVKGELPGPSRIAGANSVETSLMMAQEFLDDETEQLYIATAQNYPDALAGNSLATMNNSGILLVNGCEGELLIDESIGDWNFFTIYD